MTLAAIGLALGIVAALPGARLWQSLLFGVIATDPLTLVAVCLRCCRSRQRPYLPAKRGARGQSGALAALRMIFERRCWR